MTLATCGRQRTPNFGSTDSLRRGADLSENEVAFNSCIRSYNVDYGNVSKSTNAVGDPINSILRRLSSNICGNSLTLPNALSSLDSY